MKKLKTPTNEEIYRKPKSYLKNPISTQKYAKHVRKFLIILWKNSRLHGVNEYDGKLNFPPKIGKRQISTTEIKRQFRDHLLEFQDDRCCYCRRWLSRTGYIQNIEHVLPKSIYPQFSLDYWNLAIACHVCNTKKTKSIWGQIPTSSKTYPSPDKFNTSFHPRYHSYNEHIKYFRLETNGIALTIYKGITLQGKQLCNDLLADVAKGEILIENNRIFNNALLEIKKNSALLRHKNNHQLFAAIELISSRARSTS